jgi:hypothetical protein
VTPEYVEKTHKDLRSQFKKAHQNWKKSGNGKDNLKDNGETAHLIRILGEEYKDKQPVDDDDNPLIIKYVSDDRYEFCGNSLATAYFWGSTEKIDLMSVVTQNLGSYGNSAGDVGNARDSVADQSARGRLDVAVNSFAQTVAQLPEMFRDLMLEANSNTNQLRAALSSESDGRRRMLETASDL